MTPDVTSEPAPELMTELTADQCRNLLGAVQFGRLATVDRGRPLMLVLNHAVIDGNVYVRTREDARLALLTGGGVVLHAVFEVDSSFPVGQSGWSVMATGHLAREQDEARAGQVRSKLTAWAHGERDAVLRLEVHELTGRQVGPL
jgi:nitroimidazol reductase NimA-like FMN-containing flavoprotein (pyridoxamine 5'-phosphate oxidase superfamily)